MNGGKTVDADSCVGRGCYLSNTAAGRQMQMRLRLVFIGNSVECFQFSGLGQCDFILSFNCTR